MRSTKDSASLPIPVLVTGAGSELGLEVIKACRASSLPLRVLACDADPQALGLLWADAGVSLPDARREPAHYMNALRRLVVTDGIRVVIPTSDAELELLPRHRETFHADLRCWIAVNSPCESQRFSDKWRSHRWYVSHGLPAPRTILPDDTAAVERFLSQVGFPVVIKPRRGGGSRSLYIVHELGELRRCLDIVPQPIVQEYIGTSHEEYTAGTFRTAADDVHTIVLRRTLKHGMTYRAEVVADPALHDACRRIIRRTRLEGVNNIQFRRTADGPVILEINPRFSGTTGIRAHFGFNEPEMVVRQHALHEDVPQPVVLPGKVMRYLTEHYISAGRRAIAAGPPNRRRSEICM